jgi:hypothetical protein
VLFVGEAKAKLEGKLEAKLDPELGAELVPELGAELPAEAIAKSLALPLKPAAVTLVGKYVKLVPIDLQRDNQALFAVSNGSPCCAWCSKNR